MFYSFTNIIAFLQDIFTVNIFLLKGLLCVLRHLNKKARTSPLKLKLVSLVLLTESERRNNEEVFNSHNFVFNLCTNFQHER